MLIASCPSCREPVLLDPSLPSDSELCCPWCREQRSLGQILKSLPPMMEVVSVGRAVVQSSATLVGVGGGMSRSAGVHVALESDGIESAGFESGGFESTEEWPAADSEFDSGISPLQLEPIEMDDSVRLPAAAFSSGVLEVEAESVATLGEDMSELESPEYDSMHQSGVANDFDTDQEELGVEEVANNNSDFYVEYEPEAEELDKSVRRSHRSKKQKSPILTALGVVGGGLLALPLAGVVLYFVRPESLPAGLLTTLGLKDSQTSTLPTGGIPVHAIPGPAIDENASMDDVLAKKGFAPVVNADVPDLDTAIAASSLESSSLNLPKGDAPLSPLESTTGSGNPLGEITLPELALPSPTVDPIETPPVLSLPDSVVDVAPELLDPLKEAVAVYLKLPSPAPPDSVNVYKALAKIAADLPAGTNLHPAVGKLVDQVVTNPAMTTLLPKIEQQWWSGGAAKFKIPGIVTVGTMNPDGRSFVTDGGMKLPLSDDSSLQENGRMVLLGRIEGEENARVIKVTGVHSL